MPITVREPLRQALMPPPQEPGLVGAFKRLFSAPGTELLPTPGVVFQKAGAAALRPLFAEQLSTRGEQIPGGLGKLTSFAKDIAARQTPIVQRNLEKIQKAKTGNPITLTGFRQEVGGGPVPGRGVFFSAEPSGAVSFSPKPEAIAKTLPRRRVDVLKFKNPYVTDTTQEATIRKLIHSLPMSPRLRNIGVRILSQKDVSTGERWFLQADKWIARVLRAQGHDGLIMSNTKEIVDFGGTVTKAAK